jgi:hypothetical protein
MEVLITRVKGASQQLRTSQSGVSQAVNTAWWVGPVATTFRSRWSSTLSPALLGRADDLIAVSVALQRQVREQIIASQATGATTGSVFVGPPAPSATTNKAANKTPSATGQPTTSPTDSMTAQQLHDYYLNQALRAARINPSQWNPLRGTDANKASIEAVYEYYADLYNSDPNTFLWAGMASMIGGSFYAGFQDLGDAQKLADLIAKVNMLPGGVPLALKPLVGLSAAELKIELRYYETTLLNMQQEIFTDMATAHEAYRSGGMAAIERLYAKDSYNFGRQTIEAWRQIDEGRRTGNDALIAKGNKTLLRREQKYVIDDNYQDMRNRPVTGGAVTYLMTMLGAPSIPGAKTFAEVFPITVAGDVSVGTPHSVFGVNIPHVDVGTSISVATPFPNGNIANFDDRWALIEADTLPTYLNLAQHHQPTVTKILAIPIGQRADGNHTIDNLGRVIDDWDVDPGVSISWGK